MACGSGDCGGRVIVKEDIILQDSYDGWMSLVSDDWDAVLDGGEPREELNPPRERTFPYRAERRVPIDLSGHGSDDIWVGWDAALIESKRGIVKGRTLNIGRRKVRETASCITRRKVERHALNIGKRKVREIASCMTRRKVERHALNIGKRKVRETASCNTRDARAKLKARGIHFFSHKRRKVEGPTLNIRKRKVRETASCITSDAWAKLKARGIHLSARRALEIGLWHAAIGESECSGTLKKIAKAVATLAINGMFFVHWPGLETILSPSAYNALWRRQFSIFAKFILSIFDLEDFERMYNERVINEEHAKFYSSHLQFKEGDDWICMDDSLLIAIAEGRMDAKEFSILREHDVGEMLRTYRDLNCLTTSGTMSQWLGFRPYPLPGIGISPDDLSLVFEEMKKFVPLKEDRKMQLTLELIHMKGFHVLDSLCLEALKDLDLPKLVEYIEIARKDEHADDEYFWEFERIEPCDIASSLITGLYQVAYMKHSLLQRFQEAAAIPLLCGVFGLLAEEVLKVVEIANLERRMTGHRFISLDHILFGLSLSRVGDYVQRFLTDGSINCFRGNFSNVPLYSIYKKAGEVAKSFGREVVRLEHLVLAIVAMQRETNPSWMALDKGTSPTNDDNSWAAKLRESSINANTNINTKCAVKSWKDDDYKKDIPEECMISKRVNCYYPASVAALIRAFQSGMRLPALR